MSDGVRIIGQGGGLQEACLTKGGLSLSLLNIGAATRDLRVAHRGRQVPVVLGYQDPRAYLENPFYMGVIAGRVAGRIRGARFTLDGHAVRLPANEGRNMLHGGTGGMSHHLWQMEAAGEAAADLTYVSPDGENGFPGRVVFRMRVSLGESTVTYSMRATTDRPTPVNLAQHSYYNLTGGGDILSHRLTSPARRYLPLDAERVPTGTVDDVSGTRYDFRRGKTLGELDPRREGTDINICFDAGPAPVLPVASLDGPNGLRMQVFSDQPGAQIYTAAHLAAHDGALPGQSLAPFAGVCIEPQGYPDAVNQPGFPSVIITPDKPYRQELRLEFSEVPE